MVGTNGSHSVGARAPAHRSVDVALPNAAVRTTVIIGAAPITDLADAGRPHRDPDPVPQRRHSVRGQRCRATTTCITSNVDPPRRGWSGPRPNRRRATNIRVDVHGQRPIHSNTPSVVA
jgi:hypothetical protein